MQGKRPFIVIHSSLIELLSPEELQVWHDFLSFFEEIMPVVPQILFLRMKSDTRLFDLNQKCASASHQFLAMRSGRQ